MHKIIILRNFLKVNNGQKELNIQNKGTLFGCITFLLLKNCYIHISLKWIIKYINISNISLLVTIIF